MWLVFSAGRKLSSFSMAAYDCLDIGLMSNVLTKFTVSVVSVKQDS